MMKQRHELSAWLGHVGSDEAFAALAEMLPSAAVFAVDGDRNVVMWSDGAEALLGFGRDEVLGEHCLKANRCQECMVGCGIAELGSVNNVPLTLYRVDGVAVRLRKTARAFFDEAGDFIGGVEVLVPDRTPAAKHAGSGSEVVDFHGLVSRASAMKSVFQTIRNVAETTANTLVRGESGTGKELVARAIHNEGPRCDGPMVAVNCAALTPSLMESELFGHVKGAFTGAVADRIGIFQQAHGGTLFLDEVAELPLELQAKLLRVLEERFIVPVGGEQHVAIDVRLVAATHRSLREEVRRGRFREDLMYRLRVVPIFVPALRERDGDVDVLLRHFVGHHNATGPRIVDHIAPDAMRALLEYHWPGNVRELKNTVEYAFAVGRGPELQLDELPPEVRSERPTDAASATSNNEEARVRWALEQTNGNIGKAAELLDISRPTFWRRRKKYHL
jgi:transcriptional regulator with PAS, ATPase and Fis domain